MMKPILVFATICFLHLIRADEQQSVTEPSDTDIKDQRIINETIAQYGFPKDYKTLHLPGPELLVDKLKNSLSNQFVGESGNYTLRIRTITDHFSYNGRYEEIRIKKLQNQEFPVVVGQFGEHFERKNASYYIRTIGYTLDENGYRQFLLDLSTAETTTRKIFVVSGGHGHGGSKKKISSTVLGTLIGGNTLG